MGFLQMAAPGSVLYLVISGFRAAKPTQGCTRQGLPKLYTPSKAVHALQSVYILLEDLPHQVEQHLDTMDSTACLSAALCHVPNPNPPISPFSEMLETLTMEVRNEMELVGDHPLVSDSEREAGGTLIFSLDVDDESFPPLRLETPSN